MHTHIIACKMICVLEQWLKHLVSQGVLEQWLEHLVSQGILILKGYILFCYWL